MNLFLFILAGIIKHEDKKMATGKILFIIASEGFQPIEYEEPKKILEDAGFTIVTASDKPGIAKSEDGVTAKVDLTLDKVNVKDYDGIFLMGGPGAMEHLDNEHTGRIVKEGSERHMPLGAICVSTRILAKNNALTRKRATGWNGDGELEELYKTYDVKYLPQPVVVEENVITATDPSVAKLFGQEIITLMQNNKGWG